MPANLARDVARLRTDGQPVGAGRVLGALCFDNGFQAVVIYRLARWFKVHRVPFFGPFFSRLGLFFTGVEISPSAEIGPGLRISHGTGTVIGGFARIGADAIILHQVTIGAPSEGRVEEMPVLGDGVFLGAGAKLIGAIRVGDGAMIGVNAVVTKDVPVGAKLRTPDGA